MASRFRLTTGFVLISVVIFAVAALVITRSATRNEEANVVSVISAQSNKDARVIAEVITGLMSDSPEMTEASSAPTDHVEAENIAISAFLRTSGIVRISLFETDGGLVWSSDMTAEVETSTDGPFAESVNGEMASSLNKGSVYVNFDGKIAEGDVVATYIPLLDPDTDETGQVLEVARDVTADLNSRIDSARSSMFQTVFGALGGSFVVLFGVVMTADVLIWRSRSRAVLNERAFADEQVVAKSLELENQQLRQLNEERDRFLSLISHELRTPLTSMLGFTDVLSRNQAGEKRDRNMRQLGLMRRNGEHLNSLIEELLESTKIQNGTFEVIKEGFLVDDLVDQVTSTAQPLLKPKDQELRVRNFAKGAELHGDRKRVMQVLLNLLSNASKYSPEGTDIKLTLEVIDGSLRMTVGDEGGGIPEGESSKLFERFYRRDDEVTRSQSGLGLGLSIVKAIVNAHSGRIDVESTVGAGTEMVVTLPGARTAAQARTAPEPEAYFERRKRLARAGDLRGFHAAS